MFTKADPYSYRTFSPLYTGKTEIGSLIRDYQVTHYNKVQLNGTTSVEKSKTRKYLLLCTQRIIINNLNSIGGIRPNKNLTSYENYPLLISTFIKIDQANNKGVSFQLLNYSPKTVNTKVQTAGSTGGSSGTLASSSSSNTVGSSTAQSNSYGFSANVGFSPDGIFGGMSGNYEHSTSHTNSQSSIHGESSSSSSTRNDSHSASMSIKDWGAYAMVDPDTRSPIWTFGQEFPWDVIENRRTNGNTNPDNSEQLEIVVPASTYLQLYDGVSLYPPSQLSMFGVNFAMQALWLVTLDDSAAFDSITLNHNIGYYTGSHLLNDKPNTPSASQSSAKQYVHIYMDSGPTMLSTTPSSTRLSSSGLSSQINLALMGLKPLGIVNPAAIIGFIPSKFLVLPSSNPVGEFKTVSITNDLFIEDSTSYKEQNLGNAGFSASESSLTAQFSSTVPELQMTLFFKITDNVNEYSLMMKHWKTGSTGVILQFVFNNDTDNPIVKHVDALEAEGGENNLLGIKLRNFNYASIEFHDYLQLGLNAIDISIKPDNANSPEDCGYQVRAISVEKD